MLTALQDGLTTLWGKSIAQKRVQDCAVTLSREGGRYGEIP
jgi:hypothetical protein